MRVKAFIFDFDGTVSDTVHVSNMAMKSVYRQLTGNELEDSTVLGYSGPTEEEFISGLLPDFQGVSELYLAEFERLHSTVTTPFDAVVPLIEAIRALDLPVSMVTAKGPRVTELSFAKMPVRHLFDCVYTATSSGGIAKGHASFNRLKSGHWNPVKRRILAIPSLI